MKKKGQIIMTITIGIACFVLVTIIFMQFKVVHETDITSIETMRQADLQRELASWKAKYQEVESKYKETAKTLKKYKQESSSDEQAKKNLEEELEKLNTILGKTDIQGKGIIISLKEGDFSEENVNADDLLILVNNLRDAGAEAISINNQRIINQTDFAYIRETFIKINGKRIVSPYVIKAIGNPDYLKAALVGTGGYKESLEALGHEVLIDEKNKIEIQKYSGDMNTRYIQEN